MATDGTAVWAGSWTSPSRHTWSVRSEYSVVPQSRPPLVRAVRDAKLTTKELGAALSAGVNRRELPSLYLFSFEKGKRVARFQRFCNFFRVVP